MEVVNCNDDSALVGICFTRETFLKCGKDFFNQCKRVMELKRMEL